MADLPLVSNNLPNAKGENVQHEGNSYLTKKGDPLFLYGEKRYHSVEDWRKATGQEPRDGKTMVDTRKAASITMPADYRLKVPRELEKSPLWKTLPE